MNKAMQEVRAIVARLDPACKRILSDAADHAYRHSHTTLDVEHFLWRWCATQDDVALQRAVAKGFDPKAAMAQLERVLVTFGLGQGLPPAIADRLVGVLRDALLQLSLTGGAAMVDSGRVLLALANRLSVFEPLSRSCPAFVNLHILVEEEGDLPNEGESPSAPVVAPMLSRFTVDMTARARLGMSDPVIGRDIEISQVVEILMRRRQNNPILVGEAGVGKTAVAEGLAQRIADKQVPSGLQDARVCALDMGLLRAGAGVRGEIESRLKTLFAEIATSEQPVILFIDEAHTIVGSSGSGADAGDIANLIKPELARGTLRTIAATTWSEYKRFFEKDAALTRRFQTVRVDEPSPAAALDILQGLTPSLQKHHGVHINPSAVSAAVQLSIRFLPGRQLPDKAISILDTACARAVAALSFPMRQQVAARQRESLLRERIAALHEERDLGGACDALLEEANRELEQLVAHAGLQKLLDEDCGQKPLIRVTSEDVAGVLADWTGIPSQKMLVDQRIAAEQLEALLAGRVVGQKAALQTIAAKVRAFIAKLTDPQRPIGVFLLVGPSGVGKTETAHALAESFFGKSSITVINMSEYQEAHTVSKLKGAPAGYVGYGQGGVLTEAIRRRPYGVLLLDEVEKAHPDVLDLFLQIFDKGFIEDAEGVAVDFRNTMILLTSNASSQLLEASAGDDERQGLSDRLQESLLDDFTAAFLGRTQVIPYFALSENELRSIIQMKLGAIQRRFEDAYRCAMHIDGEVVTLVLRHCQTTSIGARWVDQFISTNLLNRVADHVLSAMAAGQPVADVGVLVQGGQIAVIASSRHDSLPDPTP